MCQNGHHGPGEKERMAGLLKLDLQVKAVVSSSYSDAPIMGNSPKYGFTMVITKPYKIAQLGKELRNSEHRKAIL
jgi:hypothetical protein